MMIDLPDFVAVAQGLGASAVEITDRKQLEQALTSMGEVDTPTLFNIVLDPAAAF